MNHESTLFGPNVMVAGIGLSGGTAAATAATGRYNRSSKTVAATAVTTSQCMFHHVGTHNVTDPNLKTKIFNIYIKLKYGINVFTTNRNCKEAQAHTTTVQGAIAMYKQYQYTYGIPIVIKLRIFVYSTIQSC